MKYKEAPPPAIDTTKVGLIRDEGSSLIPVEIDGIALTQLPEGVELIESPLSQLNGESKKLLQIQLETNLESNNKYSELCKHNKSLSYLQILGGTALLTATSWGELYMVNHGIPHTPTGPNAGLRVLAGIVGSISGSGFLLQGAEYVGQYRRSWMGAIRRQSQLESMKKLSQQLK